MTKRDELIITILTKDLKSLKKLLSDHQKQLNAIRKKGFDKEIHPGNRFNIATGLSYTIGYCTCKIEETKGIIDLLKKDAKGIQFIIDHNKKIEELNNKTMKELFNKIRTNIKTKINTKKSK